MQRKGQMDAGSSKSELAVELAVAERVMVGELLVSKWRGKSQMRRRQSSLVSLDEGELGSE